MHTRQPEVPVLSLALPGPAMIRARSQSTTSSRLSSPPPMTPRNAPAEMPPPTTSKPRNPRDSWGSWGSSENGEDDMDADWTDEQRQLLITALDMLPASIVTPFNGAVPPNNYLDKLAREVVNAHAQKNGSWPHSITRTRKMLHELAKMLEQQRRLSEIQEMHEDGKENVAGNNNGAKRPLYRQSSMDFLPGNTKNPITPNTGLDRASKRLQRADRIINPAFHPYARSGSRSPSPDPQEQQQQQPANRLPRKRSLTNAVPGAAAIVAARPGATRMSSLAQSYTPLTAAALSSAPSSFNQRTPNHLPRTPVTNTTSLPGPGPRMHRTSSFNAPPSAFPSGLKRAPSFSGYSSSGSLRSQATVNSAIARAAPVTPVAPSRTPGKHTAHQGSSDEDEKARQRKSKRARTGAESSVNKGGAVSSAAVTADSLVSPRTRSAVKAQNEAAAAISKATAVPKSPKSISGASTSPSTSSRAMSISPRMSPRSPVAATAPAPAVATATTASASAAQPPASPSEVAAARSRRRVAPPKADLDRRSPSYFGDELPRIMPAVPVNPAELPFRAQTDSPAEVYAMLGLAGRRLSPPPPSRRPAPAVAPMDVDSQSTVRVAVRRPRTSVVAAAAVASTNENDENSGSGSSQGSKRTLRRTRVAQFPTRRISFSAFALPEDSAASSDQPSGSGLDSAIQF